MARIGKNISLDYNDNQMIVRFCKAQGYTFLGFLVRCAMHEIRSSPTKMNNIQQRLWEKLFK